MTLPRFRRLALFGWIMQGLIVLSGAAVRLTEAGLGCEDWPTCNEGELLPEWQVHGLIEFGNRVISLLVTASAIAVFVAARRLRPRRTELDRFALAVVAGTVAQIVLGGVTVLLDLHPIVVAVHFLVSMGLLWASQSLWLAAGTEQVRRYDPDRLIGRLSQGLLGLAVAVLVAGTVVTGTGPHSGDSRADRLNLELTEVTRVHSTLAWLLVACVVVLAVRLAKAVGSADNDVRARALPAAYRLLVVVLAQGSIGYTQFAIGVPALLVELHILGALLVWTAAIQLHRRVHGFASGVEPALVRSGTSAASGVSIS